MSDRSRRRQVLLHPSGHSLEPGPVPEVDVASSGKAFRFFAELPGRNHIAPDGPASGHHPVELPHDLDPDLAGAPAFALDEVKLAVFAQLQIDAAVRPGVGFGDGIAPLPEGLADQALEVLP